MSTSMAIPLHSWLHYLYSSVFTVNYILQAVMADAGSAHIHGHSWWSFQLPSLAAKHSVLLHTTGFQIFNAQLPRIIVQYNNPDSIPLLHSCQLNMSSQGWIVSQTTHSHSWHSSSLVIGWSTGAAHSIIITDGAQFIQTGTRLKCRRSTQQNLSLLSFFSSNVNFIRQASMPFT